jgi:hypothetical protein
MLVVRNKKFSGHQNIIGTSYTSAQIRDGIDERTIKLIDGIDKVSDYAENSHPIVNKASKKWRNRITGYTKPIKKMLDRKRSNKQ